MALPDPVTATQHCNAVLVLADGSYHFGTGVGDIGETIGEICFNTALTGYQEILSDPSYAGQIITFTFPHIGNVGTNHEDMEATTPHCKGVILRESITAESNFRSQAHLQDWLVQHNLIGISDVDTRALTRHIREQGAQNAIIAHVREGELLDVNALLTKIKDLPTLKGQELAQTVTTQDHYTWNACSFALGQDEYATQDHPDYHVVVLDFGVKTNILRCLSDVGLRLTVLPATSTFEDITSHNPDGVFLSNGPGDPAATGAYAIAVIKQLMDANIPLFGICLGHQLLALASGLQTIKMHQGHRGANHPVYDETSQRVEITSQNHGFCVDGEVMNDDVEITHQSLFDGTIEGIRHKNTPAFSVQHHPESSPGPHDSKYLFEQFVELIRAHAKT